MLGTAGMVFALAVPANALITQGPCTGNVKYIDTNQVIDATAPLSPTIEVPLAGRLEYSGALNLPAPDTEVAYEGGVFVEFMSGSWAAATWGPALTMEVVAGGLYTYDVPSWAPKGTGAIPVVAFHDHNGTICRAKFNVALIGSPWGPVSIVVLIGAVLFMLAMLGAAFNRPDKGRGRPVLGVVAGFLFGAFLGAALFLFGLIDLDSPFLAILPFLLAFLGLVLALWGPFGSNPTAPTPTTSMDVGTAAAGSGPTAVSDTGGGDSSGGDSSGGGGSGDSSDGGDSSGGS
jgi:uncharacterized membrane protein YgcG